MWDIVLVTDTTIRKVETLTRDVAVRIGSIVRGKPTESERAKQEDHGD